MKYQTESSGYINLNNPLQVDEDNALRRDSVRKRGKKKGGKGTGIKDFSVTTQGVTEMKPSKDNKEGDENEGKCNNVVLHIHGNVPYYLKFRYFKNKYYLFKGTTVRRISWMSTET